MKFAIGWLGLTVGAFMAVPVLLVESTSVKAVLVTIQISGLLLGVVLLTIPAYRKYRETKKRLERLDRELDEEWGRTR